MSGQCSGSASNLAGARSAGPSTGASWQLVPTRRQGRRSVESGRNREAHAEQPRPEQSRHDSTSPSTKNISPKLLTRWLADAPSAIEVIRLHATHGHQFESVHFATMWSRLGKHWWRDHMKVRPQDLVPLRQNTLRELGRKRTSVRHLANIAHALGKMRVGTRAEWTEMWEVLKAAFVDGLRDELSSSP